MSILSALTTAYNYEDAFNATDCTSHEMKLAIEEWFRLYYERETTEKTDPSQRIAYTIVNKLTKTAFGEYKTTSTDEYANTILHALESKKQKAMQLTLVGGEAFLKPFPIENGFSFSVISRLNTLVFGRNAEGQPINIGTAEHVTEGQKYYTLLERRSVDAKGYLTIQNTLYQSESRGQLGRRVSLKILPRYEALPEEYTYLTPLHSLGLIYIKTPMENCIDGSQDGVSIYAPAVGLIHNIDRNEAQINGEFDRGESRIIASADLLRRDKDGRRSFDSNLFVGLDDDPEEVGVTIFSPALREQSFLARKQEYLRNVENIIGLKRGLLSEVEAAERTATEITSSAGDYNLTIIDFQQMWENALREAVILCGKLGQLYKIKDAHEVNPDDISVDWGNGILYDEDKTWADYQSMVAAGLLKPEIAVGWRFGMPTETEADIKKVRERYMPESELLNEDNEE